MKTIARRVRRLEMSFAPEAESASAMRLRARLEAGKQRLRAAGYPTHRLLVEHERAGSQIEDILRAGRMRNADLAKGKVRLGSLGQLSGRDESV
jgi:hypothetical protein